jgi:3-hydroxyisobutyrate dehydrogenase-like beta-hydroxyacid dehydrogenase
MPTIAVIAPGAMGSAVGRQLNDRGARVLTFTEGRSEQTIARAKQAGMIPASLQEIAGAELILSIVPPAEAVPLAAKLSSVLRGAKSKAAYVDLNAINPNTMQKVAAALSGTDCDVIDGTIIGLPATPGGQGPMFYVSGDPNHRTDILSKFGLRLRRIEAPIGAASSLKMVYAGMNKGTTALQTAMLLAAERAGCADSLRQELSESAPQVLARLTRAIPDMYPKAYRWVAEMQEIAEFLGPDDPAAKIFEANAEIFSQIAEDQKGERKLAEILDGIVSGKKETREKAG